MRAAAKREGREGREGMRDGVQREEFAKMPSHGSLQQAVKVRPGRGEERRRRGGGEGWGVLDYFCSRLRTSVTLNLANKNQIRLSVCLEKPICSHRTWKCAATLKGC